VNYVLLAHVVCDGCGRAWDDDRLPVDEGEGGGITPTGDVECPSCGVLDLDMGEIRLRTAWPTSRGAGRRLERRGGRVTVRGTPRRND